MDRHQSLASECQCDDLDQAAGAIRADEQQLGWIGVGIEVIGDNRMVASVEHVVVIEAVFAGRVMNLHT